jgi:predicted enzyme related to lactoylglutathione lyase
MGSKNNPVAWFEIPVTNIVRATDFYESVLELKLTFEEVKMMKMATFPMSDNTPGASGALVQATGYTPHHSGTVVYFEVSDIESGLKRVVQKGGKVLIPKTSIGEMGYIAHFEDTEGNQVAFYSQS